MRWRGPAGPLADGGYRLSLDDEREALVGPCDELRGLIESDDPGVARLFPAAYRDDPAASAEYERRRAASSAPAGLLDPCASSTRPRAPSGSTTGSSRPGAARSTTCGSCWASGSASPRTSTTGVRRNDPRAPQLALYGWLTWLQGEVVEALASRLPRPLNRHPSETNAAFARICQSPAVSLGDESRRGDPMKRALCAALSAFALLTLLTSATAAPGNAGHGLDMYSAVVGVRARRSSPAREWTSLPRARERERLQIDFVLSATQAERLRGQGVQLGLKRNRDGKTIRQLSEEQAAAGYTVWRSWDERGGIRDELYQLARSNPKIVDLRVIGRSLNGREIVALKVTRDAARTTDGSRLPRCSTCPTSTRGVDLGRGQPPAAAPLRRQLRPNAEVTNLVDTREPGSSSPPTRTATTPSTSSGCGGRTCATTTATTRSQMRTASISTATTTSTGATTTRDPPASSRAIRIVRVTRLGARDPGDART